MQKLPKATKSKDALHPRDRRSPRHAQWRARIGEGVRNAKQQKRLRGLYTITAAARQCPIPISAHAIELMIAEQRVPCVLIGSKRYINPDDVLKALTPQVLAAK